MNFAIRIFGYSESMSISTLNLCLNETNFEIENFELYSWTNCDQIIRKYGQGGMKGYAGNKWFYVMQYWGVGTKVESSRVPGNKYFE